jgi:hypothetical protein
MSQVRLGRCGAGPERHQYAIIAGNAVTMNLDPSRIYNCFYMKAQNQRWFDSRRARTLRPMRALVIYESMFGNTQRVAEAIAQGLRPRFDVAVLEVGHAEPELEDVDLVVVGGPIHAWSMSREGTRKGAHEQAEGTPIVSTGTGIREFLAAIHDANPEHPVAAATFDTAIRTRWFPVGSAARPAAKQLSKHGYRLLAKPEHFYVQDSRGPLLDGEVERAQAWASELGTRASS